MTDVRRLAEDLQILVYPGVFSVPTSAFICLSLSLWPQDPLGINSSFDSFVEIVTGEISLFVETGW